MQHKLPQTKILKMQRKLNFYVVTASWWWM